MEYQSTITIDNEKCTQLSEGTISLPMGQWVQLEWCDKPSRWVGRLPSGTLWAVHHPYKHEQFLTLCESFKGKYSPEEIALLLPSQKNK